MEDNKIKRQADGSPQIQKQLGGVYWSGSRTVQEMAELKNQILGYIQSTPCSYRLMLDLLCQQGYRKPEINRMFTDLTGLDPNLIYDINYNKYLKSPACIPGLTLAWGEAKKGNYDYYFVMPWTYGYAIFGQKGDLQRDEVSFHYTLKEAKVEFIKMVKDPIIYEDVMSVTPNVIRDRVFTKFNSLNASKEYKQAKAYLDNNKFLNAKTKESTLKTMKVQGSLTEEEYEDLKRRIE